MKRLGLGLLTSALAAAAIAPFAFAPLAHAADLPVPAGPPPVNYYRPALYDWTGIYLGGNVGAAFMRDSASQWSGVPVTTPIVGSFSNNPVGALGGGQVGANWEFAPWVVGIEGMWSGAVSMSSTTMVSAVGGSNVTLTDNLFWLASVTGRVGYAHDDLLFYAKGGGAWESVKYLENLGTGGATGLQQTITDRRTGFTVGAGLEYGLTENFSAKVEYDFYDFGTKNYNFNLVTPLSISSQVHQVLAGINYRFTPGGGRP
jgi:outer membrane immunogenic protein